ncbi:MAG TPA: DUF2911 domain-containing protein [Ferruginibacter sp.]|nr:DUF2911 domain-containing protein [Ferruginibacter sp.]
MKYLFSVSLMSLLLLTVATSSAQADKSKRPSPPALVTQKVGDATISIDYSQPSVKGRTIGKDIEPMDGEVWRTGANEATVFEVDNDITIEGKALPKGKYALFTVVDGNDWTIIFSKTWKQWGAFKYNENDDQLRVTAKADKAKEFAEKMTFTISPAGKVSLWWGDREVSFKVK